MITNNTISLTFFLVRGNAPMCFPGFMSYVLRSLNRKELQSLVWYLKLISSLQQFKSPLNACYNLVIVCKDITPKYRRTRSKNLFSTVVTFSLTMWILSRISLRHLSIKFSGYQFLRSILFKGIIWLFLQSEQIQKHL